MVEAYTNREKGANFEFIAFHDGSVKTLSELDKKLAERGVMKRFWGGKPLVVSGNSADAIPQAVHACGVLPGFRELEFAPRASGSVPLRMAMT